MLKLPLKLDYSACRLHCVQDDEIAKRKRNGDVLLKNGLLLERTVTLGSTGCVGPRFAILHPKTGLVWSTHRGWVRDWLNGNDRLTSWFPWEQLGHLTRQLPLPTKTDIRRFQPGLASVPAVVTI